jgi:hypothetical protein
MLVVSIGVTVLCWWSRGRGYGQWARRLIAAGGDGAALRVLSIRPAHGEGAVRFDTTVSAYLDLPASRIDPETLGDATVVLLPSGRDAAPVPASLSTAAGGDRVVLTPRAPLEPETRYTFAIRRGLRDTRGRAIQPISTSFTTGSRPDPTIRFEQVELPTAANLSCTSLQVGPDGRLYAGADDGRILRFPIAADGTLGAPHVITSLQSISGGPRLLIGFCFDPASTADAPVVWATHGYRAFASAPDWSGKVTRLSGRDLESAQDVVVHLPRSARDHLTNQPSFGPDRALYFPQGSNSAFGAPDEGWGDRPERLLSASILRLDVRRLPAILPLDVRTSDGGGTYDPRAPGAPLTIYAEGVRLAYDLVWASNGHLYVPTNGSSAGGHTPAGGGVPAITDVATDEHDWLFRVTPGRYYGHPNPQQDHYVLNGGNPTRGYDPAEVVQYPIGTLPDSQWAAAAYDFGNHVSPNGVIQYSAAALDAKLKGRLLVCRYNGGSDIIALSLDPAGDVSGAVVGIPGFAGLSNPLDLAEDARSGAVYVSEYGARRVTLLRPRRP